MRNFENKKQILMLEESSSIAALYRSYLSPLDLDVDIVKTGKEGIFLLNQKQYDLVLLNLKLPDISGFNVLYQIRHQQPYLPVVIISSHGSVDQAIEALRAGATDFLIKPCEADLLRKTVSKALKHKEVQTTKNPSNCFEHFIGSSLVMQAVYRVIESAAPSKATVFITGESGTGKEVCSTAIHKTSNRRDNNFVAINCAAIPKDLIESELFGHVKGAFTGAISDRKGAVEHAHGGTLFLDEICEMDLELQAKLLRFIQTGSYHKVGSSKLHNVDVRFICATNKDPWDAVKKGHFRDDLYYRLHVIPLFLPPLRDRDNDVIDIAYTFLQKFSQEEGKQFEFFSSDVIEFFKVYDWPGNVRQLQNVIRNIVVLYDSNEVKMNMLPAPLNEVRDFSFDSEYNNVNSWSCLLINDKQEISTKSKVEPLWRVEKKAILEALKICGGNVPQAAALLEVSPSTLYRKLQRWQSQSS